MEAHLSLASLWSGVILSGIYHGLNPGMGWPLGVSAALMEGKASALPKALIALALGHFLSMLLVLLPFTLLSALVDWSKQIQMGAGLLVLGFGVYLLINRRHPRMLARIAPHRLVLWSFLAALAHGAGLMLVPLFLGITGGEHAGHVAHAAMDMQEMHTMGAMFSAQSLGAAFFVAFVHTLAMSAAGSVLAVVMYFWLGLKFLSKTFFNLDLLWASSLVLVGGWALVAPQMH